MARINTAARPVLILMLVAGIVGYLLGTARSLPKTEVRAAEATQLAQAETAAVTGVTYLAAQAPKASPTKALSERRKTYYPNTEELGPTEMRVISLGTGMPNQRKSQASACWLVELGNGDKFLFDLGTGSVGNLSTLEIPYDLVNKVFVGHLHSDHVGDFAAWHIGGWVGGRQKAPRIWGPDAPKDRPEWGRSTLSTTRSNPMPGTLMAAPEDFQPSPDKSRRMSFHTTNSRSCLMRTV